jgi:hypothetical protein
MNFSSQSSWILFELIRERTRRKKIMRIFTFYRVDLLAFIVRLVYADRKDQYLGDID